MKTLKTLIVLALFFGQIFGAAYAYAPSSLLETFKVSHKNNPLDDAIRKISRSLQRLLSRKKRKKYEATQTHTHTHKQSHTQNTSSQKSKPASSTAQATWAAAGLAGNVDQQVVDAYKVLELPLGAHWGDVRRAYKRLALKHHPDKNPSNRQQATERFKTIQRAYQILKNKNDANQLYRTR